MHYTTEELKECSKKSTSIRHLLILLGLEPSGMWYRQVKKNLEELGLPIPKSTPNARNWQFGKAKIKLSLKEILVNGTYYSSHRLKNRLIQEHILSHKCNKCGLETWNNLPIPIELEHKDGNPYNNSLENLEILCPNCHAQTPTYCGKNKLKHNPKPKLLNLNHNKIKKYRTICPICGSPMCSKAKLCQSCSSKKSRKVERPSKEELQEMILKEPITKIAKKFGVSDNCVRKWANIYGIPRFSVGYWARKRADENRLALLDT